MHAILFDTNHPGLTRRNLGTTRSFAASARYRCALPNKVACASSKLWMEALQLVMWQCGLRFAHSERARNEAAARFEKFHDRPLAVPSVAPQPHA
jgi:hypothetical protein